MEVPPMRMLLLVTLVLATVGRAQATIPVAVTVDDLPVIGPDVPGMSRLAIATRLIDAFKKHRVPDVYGFVNAVSTDGRPDNLEILKAWVAAGYPLGNHTFSHKDLSQVSVADFEADVERNEQVLGILAAPEVYRVFRFPYLQEGDSRAKR